jgi:hypothetical protein
LICIKKRSDDDNDGGRVSNFSQISCYSKEFVKNEILN